MYIHLGHFFLWRDVVNSRVKVFSPHKLVYVVHFKDKSINEKIGLLKSGSVEYD